MDVNSLYPNIDHEEGAEACYEYLLQYDISPLMSKLLLRLIYLVLKCNTLSFGSRFFHQIKGTAMGTPMAVNFANLFMTKFLRLFVSGICICFVFSSIIPHQKYKSAAPLSITSRFESA